MQILHTISYRNAIFYLTLILCLGLLSTKTFAQTDLDKKVNISPSPRTVKNILVQIEEQTGLSFVYSSSQVSVKAKITLNNPSASVNEILEQIETLTALNFFPSGNQVVVKQLGYGTVTGRLMDPEGEPVEYATVSFTMGQGATTDPRGNFTIKKVPEGNRALLIRMVGYKNTQKQIMVKANETTTVPDIILEESINKLETVVVNASEKTNKFAQKETDYVARMPLDNLENPQVYSIVPKELMQEQVITDIDDALRNSPGTIPVVYVSGGFGTTFRGFDAGINARNGMETAAFRSSSDIANVERIEILKGPSGTLFGSNVSSFGGVINLVTKRPFEDNKTEISYTTGSYDLHRITTDINAPLNKEKTALFRLNTALNREKSFLNYGFNNTLLIAPSLLYKVSDRFTFILDFEVFNANSTRNRFSRYDANSGITSPEDIKLDYRKVLYHEDADAKSSSTKMFTQATYRISKNWTSTTLFSFVGEDVDRSYQYYITWLSPATASRGIGNWGPIYNNFTNIQQNINGELTTGSIKHKILIGANLRYHNARNEAGTARAIDTVDVTTDFDVLRKDELDAHIVPGQWAGWHSSDDQTLSAYVTDVVQLTDRLSTMLSLRIDHFNRGRSGTVEGYNQTALAPKLGLVYQVIQDQISVFGNYMSGFDNHAPTTQPDGSLRILDPIYAMQSEGGIKIEAFDKKLSTTISYYNITIDNAIRRDPDGFVIQDGKQVSKGFDIEVITNPVEGLNLIAGYAYNDNRIIKASDESIEGNKATGSPENVVNFWASYVFHNKLKGLGIGFGGNYVSDNFQYSDNVFTIPSYTILNTSVFYNQPKWRIGLKVNNITDQKYWSITGVPQAPANFMTNLTLRF